MKRYFLLAGLLFVASFFIIEKINDSKNVCANSISCTKNLTGSYKNVQEGEFMGKRVTVPYFIAMGDENQPVLGEKTGANKHIYVDLSTQRLFALEGNELVFDFPVSTGKWNKTPTGNFTIWVKLRYTRMAGGNPAIGTYYNLPNVPFVMFFYNKDVGKSMGFGIHGALAR